MSHVAVVNALFSPLGFLDRPVIRPTLLIPLLRHTILLFILSSPAFILLSTKFGLSERYDSFLPHEKGLTHETFLSDG